MILKETNLALYPCWNQVPPKNIFYIYAIVEMLLIVTCSCPSAN